MRYQAKTFVKQVQLDLLALSDADLVHTIDQWRPGQALRGVTPEALEVTWSALGYMPTTAPTETPPIHLVLCPESSLKRGSSGWLLHPTTCADC